ncbi:type II secretion system protein GspM [uncultured Pseudoteredinibacter sp.]|uniref:type II secretion system protein GspM n=1 Tax=uncultured Pseudoteredinibacter sp. TaxID=1641701 RepID=UPI0026142BA1|nr:type II secretion system protein GspM [uncultured Pseudoteredinibacter sp.]
MSIVQRRFGRFLIVIAAVALLVIALVWGHFVSRYFEYSAEIIRLQPLMARFVGMKNSEQRFIEADRQVRASLEQLSLSASGGADAAAAELQRKVRALASEHGMSVAGSQILPVVEGEGYQQLAINMTIKGEMPSLPSLLQGLHDLEPRVIISSAQISPARSRRNGPQSVSLRVSVLALRTRP